MLLLWYNMVYKYAAMKMEPCRTDLRKKTCPNDSHYIAQLDAGFRNFYKGEIWNTYI